MTLSPVVLAMVWARPSIMVYPVFCRVSVRPASLKIGVGTTVLEVHAILTISLISACEDGAETTSGSFTVNGDSVGGTPFSSMLERLHFSDKGAAWINRVSILLMEFRSFDPNPRTLVLLYPLKVKAVPQLKGGAASTAMREHAEHPQQCTALLAPCFVCFEEPSAALQILESISTSQRCIQRSFCAEIWSVILQSRNKKTTYLQPKAHPTYMYTQREWEGT